MITQNHMKAFKSEVGKLRPAALFSVARGKY